MSNGCVHPSDPPVKPPSQPRIQGLDVIHPYAAGLDLHKETIVACGPMTASDRQHPVATFNTCPQGLRDRIVWLKAHATTTVAVEATGVFWLPVVERLRAAGLEVLLVNAREVRSVKGRPKTDKLDCEWIRRLHACGLLRGSYLPDREIGAPKAITATARKLAIIFYRAVKAGGVVKRLTAQDYEQANRERILKNLRRRAASLGFELMPKHVATVIA